jgi:hypothetical protein
MIFTRYRHPLIRVVVYVLLIAVHYILCAIAAHSDFLSYLLGQAVEILLLFGVWWLRFAPDRGEALP